MYKNTLRYFGGNFLKRHLKRNEGVYSCVLIGKENEHSKRKR